MKEETYYFHSKPNVDLIVKKSNDKLIKMLNKTLRIKIQDLTKKAFLNILDACGSTKYRRMTVCGWLNNEKLYIGVAVCSEDDNFCKEIGRNKAYHNATTNPIDIISNWPKNANNNKTFLSYCQNVAVPRYLNNEEYRKDKSNEKSLELKTNSKLDIKKKKWYHIF